MKLDDLDRELARLQAASERVAANLVELEIDSSRRLLEAAPLTGESAARWSAAGIAMSDLWAWRELFESFLERARELRRSPRRAAECRALLTGPAIELGRSQVPLAERDLLGDAEVSTRCTANELLERMSRAFDEVKAVLAAFAHAWDTLTPRLAAARQALHETSELAASLEEPGHRDVEAGRRDLTEAADRVAQLTAALSADPLAVRKQEVERVAASLEAIRRELQAALALRAELEARLADARALLARLRSTAEAGRSAHEELLVKIAAPAAPSPLEPDDALGGELDDIAALARSGGAWREARHRLDGWTARVQARLEEAERILAANHAPIEARNQLRALLEAYQIKASRLGVVEDPQLARTFAQAHAALYTAPSDLVAAAQLVRSYQQGLSAPEAVR